MKALKEANRTAQKIQIMAKKSSMVIENTNMLIQMIKAIFKRKRARKLFADPYPLFICQILSIEEIRAE